MLHRKNDGRGLYRQVFADGEKDGFRVTDVTHRLEGTHGGVMKEVVCVEVATPFTYDGIPVNAVAMVDVTPGSEANGAVPYSGGDRVQGLRQYRDCMLCLDDAHGGKNLEDVSERATGSRAFVVMRDGQPVAGVKALDSAGRFASAASFYPSVMDYKQYKELGDHKFKKSGLSDGATPEGYLRYLDHTRRMMETTHIRYVGKATSARQVQGMIDEFQGETGKSVEWCPAMQESFQEMGT